MSSAPPVRFDRVVRSNSGDTRRIWRPFGVKHSSYPHQPGSALGYITHNEYREAKASSHGFHQGRCPHGFYAGTCPHGCRPALRYLPEDSPAPPQLTAYEAPAHEDPSYGVPAQPAYVAPAQPAPAQPAYVAPAQPAPAQPTPAQPAPAQPTPAQPTPAQPAPATTPFYTPSAQRGGKRTRTRARRSKKATRRS